MNWQPAAHASRDICRRRHVTFKLGLAYNVSDSIGSHKILISDRDLKLFRWINSTNLLCLPNAKHHLLKALLGPKNHRNRTIEPPSWSQISVTLNHWIILYFSLSQIVPRRPTSLLISLTHHNQSTILISSLYLIYSILLYEILTYTLVLSVSKRKSILTHLEFRTALYTTLLGSSLDVKIHRIEAELGTKRAFENNLSHVHQVFKRKQGTCIWCSVSIWVQKLWGEVYDTIGRSWYSCSFCDVSLCINSNC
jgi:hypothetical protein